MNSDHGNNGSGSDERGGDGGGEQGNNDQRQLLSTAINSILSELHSSAGDGTGGTGGISRTAPADSGLPAQQLALQGLDGSSQIDGRLLSLTAAGAAGSLRSLSQLQSQIGNASFTDGLNSNAAVDTTAPLRHLLQRLGEIGNASLTGGTASNASVGMAALPRPPQQQIGSAHLTGGTTPNASAATQHLLGTAALPQPPQQQLGSASLTGGSTSNASAAAQHLLQLLAATAAPSAAATAPTPTPTEQHLLQLLSQVGNALLAGGPSTAAAASLPGHLQQQLQSQINNASLMGGTTSNTTDAASALPQHLLQLPCQIDSDSLAGRPNFNTAETQINNASLRGGRDTGTSAAATSALPQHLFQLEHQIGTASRTGGSVNSGTTAAAAAALSHLLQLGNSSLSGGPNFNSNANAVTTTANATTAALPRHLLQVQHQIGNAALAGDGPNSNEVLSQHLLQSLTSGQQYTHPQLASSLLPNNNAIHAYYLYNLLASAGIEPHRSARLLNEQGAAQGIDRAAAQLLRPDMAHRSLLQPDSAAAATARDRPMPLRAGNAASLPLSATDCFGARSLKTTLTSSNANISDSQAARNTRDGPGEGKQEEAVDLNGVSLAIPSDNEFLDPLHRFIRSRCIEFFVSTKDDMTAPGRGARPSKVGQVGLRCKFCRGGPRKVLARQAVCFPSKRETIYESVRNFMRTHMEACQYVPKEARGTYDALVLHSALQKTAQKHLKAYYAEAAGELGIVDSPGGLLVMGGQPNESGTPSPSLLRLIEAAKNPSAFMSFWESQEPSVGKDSAIGMRKFEHVASERTRAVIADARGQPTPLVRPEDFAMTSDFDFLLFHQVVPLPVSTSRLKTEGLDAEQIPDFFGFRCKHCGRATSTGSHRRGMHFSADVDTLPDTGFVNKMLSHFISCSDVPQEVKDAFGELKQLAVDHGTSGKRGSRKRFTRKIWERMKRHYGLKSDSGDKDK